MNTVGTCRYIESINAHSHMYSIPSILNPHINVASLEWIHLISSRHIPSLIRTHSKKDIAMHIKVMWAATKCINVGVKPSSIPTIPTCSFTTNCILSFFVRKCTFPWPAQKDALLRISLMGNTTIILQCSLRITISQLLKNVRLHISKIFCIFFLWNVPLVHDIFPVPFTNVVWVVYGNSNMESLFLKTLKQASQKTKERHWPCRHLWKFSFTICVSIYFFSYFSRCVSACI